MTKNNNLTICPDQNQRRRKILQNSDQKQHWNELSIQGVIWRHQSDHLDVMRSFKMEKLIMRNMEGVNWRLICYVVCNWRDLQDLGQEIYVNWGSKKFLEPLLNEVTSKFFENWSLFPYPGSPTALFMWKSFELWYRITNIHTDIVKTFRGIHPDFMIEINQSCKDHM